MASPLAACDWASVLPKRPRCADLHVHGSFLPRTDSRSGRKWRSRRVLHWVWRVCRLSGGFVVDECRRQYTRLTGTGFQHMRLSQHELMALRPCILQGLSPIGAKYMCWRKSTLQLACLPCIAASVLKAQQTWANASWPTFRTKLVRYLPVVTPAAAEHFHVFFHLWTVQNAVYAITMLGGIACTLAGTLLWTRYATSRSVIRTGYFIAFVLPYLAMFFVPYRQSVDFDAVKKDICRSRMAAVPDLALLSRANLTVELCNLQPTDWIPTIKARLDASGMLLDAERGTCDNAVRVHNQIEQAMQGTSTLAPAIWNATLDANASFWELANRLNPHSRRAQRVSVDDEDTEVTEDSGSAEDEDDAVEARKHGPQPGVGAPFGGGVTMDGVMAAGKNTTNALLNRTKHWLPTPELTATVTQAPSPCDIEPACANCFSSQLCMSMAAVFQFGVVPSLPCAQCYEPMPSLDNLTCMQKCGKRHLLPFMSGSTLALCVPQSWVDEFQVLLAMNYQIDYSQFLVGGFVGASALQSLLPASVCLLFGCIKGARIAKLIAPWSRLPGYSMAGTIMLCLPLVSVVLTIFQQVVGDPWSLSAFILLVLSVLIWLPVGDFSHGVVANDFGGLIGPQSAESAANEISARARYSNLLRLASGACLIVFMTLSDIGRIVKGEFVDYVRTELKRSVLSVLTQTLAAFFLDLVGKALLSTVVFSDVFVELFRSTTQGDTCDPEDIKRQRQVLAMALDTLFSSTAAATSAAHSSRGIVGNSTETGQPPTWMPPNRVTPLELLLLKTVDTTPQHLSGPPSEVESATSYSTVATMESFSSLADVTDQEQPEHPFQSTIFPLNESPPTTTLPTTELQAPDSEPQTFEEIAIAIVR